MLAHELHLHNGPGFVQVFSPLHHLTPLPLVHPINFVRSFSKNLIQISFLEKTPLTSRPIKHKEKT